MSTRGLSSGYHRGRAHIRKLLADREAKRLAEAKKPSVETVNNEAKKEQSK